MDVRGAIEARRAYRSLEPVEIPDDVVRDLSRVAGLAASCFNNQPWRFIFVRSPDVLGELFGALSKWNKWATAASMIVVVVSKADYDCQIRGREYFLFDTGMATAHLILRATELGLVAHPIAGYSPKKVRAVLGIPDEMSVVTLVIVGKRAGGVSELLSEDQARVESERPARLRLEEFAFMDRYEAEVSQDD